MSTRCIDINALYYLCINSRHFTYSYFSNLILMKSNIFLTGRNVHLSVLDCISKTGYIFCILLSMDVFTRQQYRFNS